jgi:hypothetical protein
MSLLKQIATQFRQVHFGGNWTSVDLKNTLEGITWEQATTEVHSFNTIAVLVYHVNYYVKVVLRVMRGQPLDAHDKYAFDCPPIQSQEDWDQLVGKLFSDAEEFAQLAEQLPESRLWENLASEKYGNYYRNITGIIEHTHYHLGQIVLIKKIINLPS